MFISYSISVPISNRKIMDIMNFLSGRPSLPNNNRLAAARLQHLKKRLKYTQIYIVITTRPLWRRSLTKVILNQPQWYPKERLYGTSTPWVYHSQKPDNLRVMFDCSAKFCSTSLNDNLLTRPDLINSLVGVLCSFRKVLVAVTCDIEKMFQQFLVPPEEPSYLRFLWWEGWDLEKGPQDYYMAVHLFGTTSSPEHANFGLKYLMQQQKVNHLSASEFFEKNFYVDDVLTSVRSVDEAKELIIDAQDLCKRGGLRLHKINSKEEDVLCCIAPSERI